MAFLFAVLPFGMNFIEFISHGIASGLTIYSYNLLYLLPIALLDELKADELPRVPRAASRIFGSIAQA